MNHASFKTCVYCGSTLHKRFGVPHCSGDNLHTTKAIFDSLLSLKDSSPETFSLKLENLRINECVFDLFIDYWTKKKKKDSTVNLICLHEETYQRSIEPVEHKLPMPEPYIPFPDLIEVAIAEIMLGRELTGLEKDGSRHIPKIDIDGQHYFAPLTWITWPHSYISLKDMVLKTDYNEGPAPVIFEIEEIRGIYADRDGDNIDE